LHTWKEDAFLLLFLCLFPINWIKGVAIQKQDISWLFITTSAKKIWNSPRDAATAPSNYLQAHRANSTLTFLKRSAQK
jgi:hypothetical protein